MSSGFRYLPFSTMCLCLLVLSARGEPATSIRMSLCTINVPPILARGNATFTETFIAHLDLGGGVTRVESKSTNFLDPGQFEQCLGKWKFNGLALEKFVVEFVWKHGEGWRSIALLGKNYSIVLDVPSGLLASGQYQADDSKRQQKRRK